MDVEVARVLALGLAGGTGRSDVPRKKATLTYFVKQWMPRNQHWPSTPYSGEFHLTHVGDGAHDERVEAAPDVAFRARHGRDVGLHGGGAVGLRDLRVAACEEGRLCDFAGLRLRRRLARLGRLRSEPLCGGLLCDLRRLLGRPFGNDGERVGRGFAHWSILLSRSSRWSNRLCQNPAIWLVQSISGAKAPSCA